MYSSFQVHLVAPSKTRHILETYCPKLQVQYLKKTKTKHDAAENILKISYKMHLKTCIRLLAGYKLECEELSLGKTLSDGGQIVQFEMVMLSAVNGCCSLPLFKLLKPCTRCWMPLSALRKPALKTSCQEVVQSDLALLLRAQSVWQPGRRLWF